MKTLKIQLLFLLVLFTCFGHISFDVVAKPKERILVAHAPDEKREKEKKHKEHEKKPRHEDERKKEEKRKPHGEKESKEKIKKFEREGRNLEKRERKLEEELKELNERIAKEKARLKENDNFLNRFRLENLLRKARRLTEELNKLRKQKQAMGIDLTFNRSRRVSEINLRLAQIPPLEKGGRGDWNAAKDNRTKSAKIAREISLLVNERANIRHSLLKTYAYKPKGPGWRLKEGHGPKELNTRVALARHRLKEVQKQLSSIDRLRLELESQKQLNAKLLKLPNFANSFYPTVRNAAKALRDDIKILNKQIEQLNVERRALSENASLFREIIAQFEASQKHTEDRKD